MDLLFISNNAKQTESAASLVRWFVRCPFRQGRQCVMNDVIYTNAGQGEAWNEAVCQPTARYQLREFRPRSNRQFRLLRKLEFRRSWNDSTPLE
jgi:hypothetical protein